MGSTRERIIKVRSGWGMLLFNLIILITSVGLVIFSATLAEMTNNDSYYLLLALAVPLIAIGIIFLFGHFTLQPNEARVLLLFGEYKGTVAESGFFWVNPFFSKLEISLRTRNFDSGKLKVNDKRGNPIDISSVIVWRVVDTAKAVFDVDYYEHFVKVQSESALRHLANDYPYDSGEDEDSNEVTLRSGGDEVNLALQKQVQEHLLKAGVEIEEARLNHLAYSSEIASAMLRRQQAEAIIAARKKIVHGAVSMVEMALKDLNEQKIVKLDEERKAAMVSNLLVVLCGETEVHPVINTGTHSNVGES